MVYLKCGLIGNGELREFRKGYTGSESFLLIHWYQTACIQIIIYVL
jgi:hypothetical protein